MSFLRNIYKNSIGRLQQLEFFDTLKNTSVYFSATLLVNLLGIISIPIFTLYLETSEFGIVEIFNHSIKVLAVLMTFNTHQAVGRYYYEEKNDWKEFLGTSFTLSIGLFLMFSMLCYFLKDKILSLINIPAELFYFLFPATLGLIIFTIFNHLYVAKKESLTFSIYQVLQSYSRFIFAWLGILLIAPAYFGKIAGDSLIYIFIALTAFVKIYPNIKWKILKKHIAYILKFTLPLIPFSLSGFILNFFDLFMINSESNANAGLYAFAYKIGLLLIGLNQALHNAASPNFYKWRNKGEKGLIKGQEKSIIKFVTIGASFLILFASDLGNILAQKEAYKASLSLIPIIVLGLFFNSIYSFFSRSIFYSKKTIYISIITILAGILNIVLNSIYIPIYGYEAAAYTTVVSYLFLALLGAFCSITLLKNTPPPLYNIVVCTLYLFIILGCQYFISERMEESIQSLSVKIVVFIILFLILFGGKVSLLFKDQDENNSDNL